MMKFKLVKTSLLVVILTVTIVFSSVIQFGGTVKESNMHSLGNSLQRFASTPYALSDFSELEDVGLSNPSNVGVVKNNFQEQDKYTMPEADIVVYATDYGVVANDNIDDTVSLYNALNYLKGKEGVKKLVLPEGALDFVEGAHLEDGFYAIILRDFDNLIIQGDNTDIYLHGQFSFMLLERTENFFFTGINLDYVRPTVSTAKVIYSNTAERKVIVKVNDNYPVDEYTEIKSYMEFDRITRHVRPGGNIKWREHNVNHFKSVTLIEPQTLEIIFNSDITNIPLNTLVALSHNMRGYEGFMVKDCKNLTFQNINVYNAPSMGIAAYLTKDLYFNRFNIMIKPESDRLMTTGSDGMHFMECSGEIEISNSLIENTHDDGVNVHGVYMNVKSVDSLRQMTINKRNYDFPPEVGNEIEIRDSKMNIVDTLVIESITYNIASKDYTVTFTEDINQEVKSGQYISNNARAAKLLFENNIVRNKKNRGLLFQTRDGIIRNNTFSSIAGASIVMLSQYQPYIASMTPKNVIIENNKFVGNNVSGSSQGDIVTVSSGEGGVEASSDTIENIVIRNNFIALCQTVGVSLQSVKNSVVENNLLYNNALNPVLDRDNSSIYLSSAKDITIKGNYALCEHANSKYVSIRVSETVEKDTLVVEDNTNLAVGVGAFESPEEFLIGRIETVIEVDGNLNEWHGIGTDLIIKGISVSGEEAKKDGSDFKINMFKMGYTSDGLYFAIDVFDDEAQFINGNVWNGDCVELLMTSNLDYDMELKDMVTNETMSNYTSAQLFILPQSYEGVEYNALRFSDVRTSAWLIDAGVEEYFNCVMVPKITNGVYGGYFVEGFISFEAFPELFSEQIEGSQMSFVVNLIDLDQGKPRAQIATTHHNVEQTKKIPLRMSKITLI